jgi:ammonium transporter, Amt family
MVDSWVIVAAAILLLRVGMALYLAGLSRSKNAIASLFRSVAEIAVGILAFWALGGLILFGSWHEPASAIDSYQCLLASAFLIGPAVLAGATLERARTRVNILAAVLLSGILSPLAYRMLGGPWFINHGFADLAGATFIHFPAAVVAIVAVFALGPRTGKYNRDRSTNVIVGHHLPMLVTGVLIMLAMWLPYVAAFNFLGVEWSAFNVLLCASASVVAAMAYCKFRFGRFAVLLVIVGLLGGLVSITAGATRLSSPAAVFTGAVAGILIPYAAVKLDLVWKIDDPASAICIHGLGGAWSAIATAILASGTFAERLDRLLVTAIALAAVALLSLVLAAVIFFPAKALIGIRCKEADEADGLDLAELDLNAYPDFQQTMIKSYHLREM